MVSLDPSLRGFGWAAWKAGELAGCGVIAAPDELRNLDAWLYLSYEVGSAAARLVGGPVEIVGEKPQVYRGSKADPDDLLQLAGALGAVAGHLRGVGLLAAETWTPTPRQWKGNRPKEVTSAAAMRALTPEETLRLNDCLATVNEAARHNAMDAVALGLRYLKRMR